MPQLICQQCKEELGYRQGKLVHAKHLFIWHAPILMKPKTKRKKK